MSGVGYCNIDDRGGIDATTHRCHDPTIKRAVVVCWRNERDVVKSCSNINNNLGTSKYSIVASYWSCPHTLYQI